MQLCGFVIGGFCVLDRTKLWTCWPSVYISPTCVGLSQNNLEALSIKGPVSVHVYDTQINKLPDAHEVELSAKYDLLISLSL